ncbi:MAG: MerR family transcriptional regulator [Anaerolineae bacterium]|nr:MerR family transcriptional regulator [Anaerolineae bacterium]
MHQDLPVYIISAAADLLGVHARTLYLYEQKGLVIPARKGNRRYYSERDLQWVRDLRFLVHERGLNLEGLRQLLALRAQLAYETSEAPLPDACAELVSPRMPCWQNGAARFDCRSCPVYDTARMSLRQDQGIAGQAD